MKDHIFEELLRAERDRRLPSCPANLEANVLRRVRLAASLNEDLSVLGWLTTLFPMKALSVGFLATVVLLSVFSSTLVTSSSLRASETRNMAAASLDFGVFENTSILKFER